MFNKFTKQFSAYHDKARENYDKLNQDLAGLRKALESGRVVADREKSTFSNLRDAAHGTTEAISRQHQAWSEAASRVSTLESDISQIESRISSLRRRVELPERYSAAKKKIEDLSAQQTVLKKDMKKVDELLAKLVKRIAELETRNAAEIKAVAQSLLDNDGAFVSPESLTKLEVELRITKASHEDLQRSRAALDGKLRELPDEIDEAMREYNFCRADVAEIELHGQLAPLLSLFARALVARRQCHNGQDDARRYEIEISQELIEAAEAALTAEMPIA